MKKIDIEIPKALYHLKQDARGYPIPFTVLVDKEGTPHFKVNMSELVDLCIDQKICHVCGRALRGEYWFIGGPLSAFHPHGAFADPPVHKLCGTFALQYCPYLSRTSYQAKGTISPEIKMITHNPTQTDERLERFIFAHSKDFTVSRPNSVERFIKPVRPYLEVEVWKDGKKEQAHHR